MHYTLFISVLTVFVLHVEEIVCASSFVYRAAQDDACNSLIANQSLETITVANNSEYEEVRSAHWYGTQCHILYETTQAHD
jgi:hypothetical protein